MTNAPTPPADPIVEFVRVAKTYGQIPAVDDVSFSINRGEFFSLLGPSGCGKTTTLRLLAGLETPDEGEIRIAGESVNRRRPYERRLGMVFQSYALFPHLTVGRNVSFGLERRGVSTSEIPALVARALNMVRLDRSFTGRMPVQLSGGQRQRVALARALVLEPAILLLDEPLGALDLKLRREMQIELKELNRELGTTFLYVTHDQEEALAMSDRIAVMDQGRIAQLGSPAELYEYPRTRFVATFLGDANLLEGPVHQADGGWLVEAGGRRVRVTVHPSLATGGRVLVALRPERLSVVGREAVPAGMDAVAAVVEEVVYLGDAWRVHVRAEGLERLTAMIRTNEPEAVWRRGDLVMACWRPQDLRVLEPA